MHNTDMQAPDGHLDWLPCDSTLVPLITTYYLTSLMYYDENAAAAFIF